MRISATSCVVKTIRGKFHAFQFIPVPAVSGIATLLFRLFNSRWRYNINSLCTLPLDTRGMILVPRGKELLRGLKLVHGFSLFLRHASFLKAIRVLFVFLLLSLFISNSCGNSREFARLLVDRFHSCLD